MGKLHIVDEAAIVDWVRSVQHTRSCSMHLHLGQLPLTASLITLTQDALSHNLQVLTCQHASGGFGGSERHDAHLLYTLSAIQVLALYDKLHLINVDQVVACKLVTRLATDHITSTMQTAKQF